MNYEELYSALQPDIKELKDAASAAVRLQKAIVKHTETGNLAEVRKALDQIDDALKKADVAATCLSAELDGFDISEYFAGGDFSRQLLEACVDAEIDVKGEHGVYEMFPYKVRVIGDDDHAGEVYINRKKLPSFRPAYVASFIKAGQEKLYKGNFKAESFMEELAAGYEMTCLRSNARVGSTQVLTKIYKNMVPMARARKEYDMQAFSFDLARIYEAGTDAWVTKSGQRYYFGTSRDGKTGIRVLSRTGVETYISTLKPLNDEE
ncbi:MAG: hypothetical protein J6E32_04255 [Lachnospiraceae bacterium]|nr:hypothetical protein [Lachnospiraceae bacterium]